MGFFDKIKKLNIFSGFSAIDDDFYDELEETLIPVSYTHLDVYKRQP